MIKAFEELDRIVLGSTVPVRIGAVDKPGKVVAISQSALCYVIRMIGSNVLVRVHAKDLVEALLREKE